MPIEKFGYLTGRSSTIFKRDFKRAFNSIPQKWLTQKRLELTHYQIAERKVKPIEACYETGFENLSHFSLLSKNNSDTPLQKQLRQGTYTNAGRPKNSWLKSRTVISAVYPSAVKKQPNHRIFAANSARIHLKMGQNDQNLQWYRLTGHKRLGRKRHPAINRRRRTKY